MLRRRFQYLLLAVLLPAWPHAASGQEIAQLKYSVVSGYLELFKSLEHLDRIAPSMMISSTNPEIEPRFIQLRIKTPDGWQTFSPDENDVIEFPYRPDWAHLTLISNQPKGTLQLAIGFTARPLNGTAIPYRDLMALVPQFDEALSALAAVQGQEPPKIKGLTVRLPEGSGASVHVLSQKGRQTLKSNSFGVVILRYSEALWEENPAVEFDELPLGIVPLR